LLRAIDFEAPGNAARPTKAIYTKEKKGGWLADWLGETCANPSYAFILNLNYSLPAQQSDSEAGKGKQK